MTTILHTLPERVRLELRLNDLLDYLTRMDTNYRRMQKYGTEQKDYERVTLEDFARSVISHDPSSVVNLVERIYAFVVPKGQGITNSGLFQLLGTNMQVSLPANVHNRTCKIVQNFRCISLRLLSDRIYLKCREGLLYFYTLIFGI